MGRLRSRLANHQADKVAAKRISDAEAALFAAMDAYKGVLKTGSTKEKRRAASSIDQIRRALRALNGVQAVGDRYDVRDPDLVPEKDKVARTGNQTRRSAE